MQERGGEVRRLARAPGERYAGGPAAPEPPRWSRRRRVLGAVAVALGGGVVTFLIAGLDVGPGLLAVAGGAGWLTGLALAGGARAGHGEDAGRGRAALAAVLAGWGIAAGILGDGVRSLAEGGVLAPWAYADERFGPLAVAFVAVAAIAGGLRGR